jgi:hypothetical protein
MLPPCVMIRPRNVDLTDPSSDFIFLVFAGQGVKSKVQLGSFANGAAVRS